MATTSFDKKIVIYDDKAAKALISAATDTTSARNQPVRDIRKQLERGSLLLKSKYSR